MEAYYYQRLSKPQQSAYHAMKVGFTSLAASFSVPRLDDQTLSTIFFQLRLDCPEIFYVSGYSYRFYQDASHIEMIPTYLFDKNKIREHQKALTARITKLTRPAEKMTEWEKELYIHDFICQNVRYDKLKKAYSHEIIGPLGQGVGVCEGIAKSVKVLCDALGIWCMIAISDAAPDKGIKYRHAWNIVRLGGKYYHLDVTFDNSLGHDGIIRYDYYNLDDQHLLRDHQPLLYPAPACTDSTRAYYREKKLSFTKTEEVVKRAGQAIRKGSTLVFHWRGGHLTRQILAELLELLEQEAQKKGRHARISINWPQAVLQLSFPQEAPADVCVEEDANEGERYEAQS